MAQKAANSIPVPAMSMNGAAAPAYFTAINARQVEHNAPEPLRLGASEATKQKLRMQFEAAKLYKKPDHTVNLITTPRVTPHTPQQIDHGTSHKLQNYTPAPSTPNVKDDGPYKAMMMARLQGMPKGARVIPPCDRCRRLKMDCLKNLTACVGCTKKHAKCSWKDVKTHESIGSIEQSIEGDVSEPSLERLLQVVRDDPGEPAVNVSAHTSIGSHNDELYHAATGGLSNSPGPAISLAVAGLAEVAKASTAALEPNEAEMFVPQDMSDVGVPDSDHHHLHHHHHLLHQPQPQQQYHERDVEGDEEPAQTMVAAASMAYEVTNTNNINTATDSISTLR